MNINRDNYEIFVIDFLEGNLSEKEMIAFQLFLSENDDIKNEVEGFDEVNLVAENVVFSEKTNLKKTEFSDNINCSYFEELCITKIEDELTLEQHKDFNKLINESNNNKEIYNQFVKAKLSPNFNIIYKDKKKLKKYFLSTKSILYATMSIAASLIFIFMIIKSIDNKNTNYQAFNSNKNFNEYNSHRMVFEKKSSDNSKLQNINKAQNKIVNTIIPNITELQNNENQIAENNVTALKRETENILSVEKISTNKISTIYDTNQTIELAYNPNVAEQLNVYEKYQHTKELITSTIKNKIDKTRETEFTAFEIAETAIKGYNNLTESDVKLQKILDENGNMAAINITSSNFDFFTNKIGR